MDQELTQADHSMEFAVGHLQDALKFATSVEAIILLDLIETAAKLKNQIEHFASAREDDQQ